MKVLTTVITSAFGNIYELRADSSYAPPFLASGRHVDIPIADYRDERLVQLNLIALKCLAMGEHRFQTQQDLDRRGVAPGTDTIPYVEVDELACEHAREVMAFCEGVSDEPRAFEHEYQALQREGGCDEAAMGVLQQRSDAFLVQHAAQSAEAGTDNDIIDFGDQALLETYTLAGVLRGLCDRAMARIEHEFMAAYCDLRARGVSFEQMEGAFNEAVQNQLASRRYVLATDPEAFIGSGQTVPSASKSIDWSQKTLESIGCAVEELAKEDLNGMSAGIVVQPPPVQSANEMRREVARLRV